MPSLWEASVAMEVCKADLGLALAQNFKKGCRRARADLLYLRAAVGAVGWPLSASWCIWTAGGVSTGRSIGRTARMRAVGESYFHFLLYNIQSLFAPRKPVEKSVYCLMCPLMVHSQSHSGAYNVR